MKNSKFSFNWPHIGNKHIVEYLSKSINNNSLANAYIFYGPDNLGKTTIANFFAQSLLCEGGRSGKGQLPCGECSSCKQFLINKIQKNHLQDKDVAGQEIIHSDFYLLKKNKEKKNISVSEVREFIGYLGLSSFLNSYKIGIIKHADELSQEAANALLKTLEEPRAKVVIILITSSLDALPSTIVSRSQLLKFNPVATDVIYEFLIKEYKAKRSEAKNFSRLSLGRPALALKFFEDKDFYNSYLNRAQTFIEMVGSNTNDRLEKIENFFGPKSNGQEAVKIAQRILEIWQGVCRDLILRNNEHYNLVQHEIINDGLEKIQNKYKNIDLLRIIRGIDRAKKYLSANVGPKLVLQDVVIKL